MNVAVNPLLAHAWGVSPGADAVWADISGRAPSGKPWERPVMVLHAYIDDSDSHGPDTRKAYVLGGYIATPEAWAAFAAEWEGALEALNVPRGKSGRRRFKMNEMARRMADVPPFYGIITRHTLAAFSMVIYDDDLERAKERIWSDNTEILYTPPDEGRNLVKRVLVSQLYEMMIDPSVLLMSTGSKRFSELLSENRDRIEIYFDKDESEPWITDWWDEYIAQKNTDLEIYGTRAPQFVDDEEYLPIQAADFWAWWARQAHETGTFAELVRGDFGSWKGPNGPPTLAMNMDEDGITGYFLDSFARSVPMGFHANFYDAKITPKTDHAMLVGRAKNRSQMLEQLEGLLRRFRRR